MSELEEKLEGILGNPQAMSQIMSLAQSLNLGGSGQDPGQGQQADQAPGPAAPSQSEDAPAPPSPAPAGLGGGLGGMLGALGNLDAGTLSAAAQLMGQFNSGGGDDQRVALLTALRPFVKEERYAKLDKAIQIAKLSRLIRGGLDLFRARKEDGHV
ncbi:MAG: hypothetical protein HDT37_08550 [Clostridiales bacterium]|nr:hypothetical protein [Clostridiales bacterium]